MSEPDAPGPRTGRVRFRLLGTVQILVDDQPVPLGGIRISVLLAMLLLEPNTVVPTERITEALWSERPPEMGHAVVYSYILRLRESLRAADPSSLCGSSASHLDTRWWSTRP